MDGGDLYKKILSIYVTISNILGNLWSVGVKHNPWQCVYLCSARNIQTTSTFPPKKTSDWPTRTTCPVASLSHAAWDGGQTSATRRQWWAHSTEPPWRTDWQRIAGRLQQTWDEPLTPVFVYLIVMPWSTGVVWRSLGLSLNETDWRRVGDRGADPSFL